MAKLELIWANRALSEYKNLTLYLLEEWGEQKTREILNDLAAQIIRVQNTPEQFQIIIKRKSIRRCVFSPQTSIYFRISKNRIEILSLFDNRQNPKKLGGL